MLDVYTFISLFDSIISVVIPFVIISKWQILSKSFLLYIIFVLAIGILFLYINVSIYVLLIPLVAIPIILLYRSEKNLFKSIVIPIYSLIIFIVSENIVIIFNNIFITSNRIERSGPKFVLILFITLIINFLISKLTAFIMQKTEFFEIIDIKGKTAILFIIGLFLTLIAFYANIIIRGQNGKPILGINIDIVNAVIFLIYFVLLLMIIGTIFNDVKKEEELKNLNIYTKSLEESNTVIREFRHDYINVYTAMDGYFQAKKYEDAEKFFYENISPISKAMFNKGIEIGILQNIKNPGLKSLVSSKIIVAQEKGIDINIEIVDSIENINMDIADLYKSIGILLDNAIEESLNCKEPKIQFAIIDKESVVKLIFVNNFNQDNINLNQIFEKGFSTKGENRGIGLYNLRMILNNFKNITLDTIVNDDEFSQILNIKK